ncbi:MAG: Gfo/Idh/MocA family oxidoreductase [Phycisphaerae bacterium]|jgi:predicted dehydrogenase|nr:Gfo/Idh/MocA family oxidoreductase [Phycisphaerae bacterium]MBT5409237.1 Gfo/Idh/MocA family oxidoreductase [Phycisphaerae bacterium]MBT7657972.1 Gfo/Idh/MocA family oxidoreductase [Phycisphaerae bacterium]|tara:strand:+ start:1031 stop:2047 length:1017 start_codon:yes stop_codon:yes gene_type:complete
MTETKTLRCAVVGVGRMGQHHARIYSQMDDIEFVGVVDQSEERRNDIVEEWGGKAFATVEELIDAGVDAVTIATPTIYHLEVAEPLLERGIGCLIEKPLAPTAEVANAIADAAETGSAVLQVGHVVRYDPVMRAVASIENLKPRFIEMVRISPMTFRSTDVGVVLDMMIHDLDLLTMLTGKEPTDIHANAVSVMGEAEDMCNARLEFNGCTANVTASRLGLKTERKLRIISEDSYVSADFVNKSVTMVRKIANEEQLLDLRTRLAAGEDLSSIDYVDLVEVEEPVVGDEDALTLQAKDFLHSVRTGEKPYIDAEAGSMAIRTAERIMEQATASGARML